MVERAPASRRAKRAKHISAAIEIGALVLGVALRVWAARQAQGARDAEVPRAHRAEPTPPARGWREVLVRASREFLQDQIPSVASGVAYSAVVAIFPAMAAFVSLYGLFADPAGVRRQLDVMNGVIPGEALGLLEDQMTRITSQNHSGLGFAFAVGLVASLWSANAGVGALIRGLNIAYEAREARGFVRRALLSLALTLGAVLFLVAASALVIAAPAALSALHLDATTRGLALLRWPALAATSLLALAVLYRWGPDRPGARWRWVTPGALAATGLWIGGSLVFSWYIAHFGRYDATYGSLGALFGFLTWLWLSILIVLFGAELNCEVERGRRREAPAPYTPEPATETFTERVCPDIGGSGLRAAEWGRDAGR